MNGNTASGQTPDILTPEIIEALEYRIEHLEGGFSLIPLIDGTKLPAIRWDMHKTAPASEDQVIDWMVGVGLFSRHPARPELNITSARNHGIVTGVVSNIVVLDLDDARAIRFAERLGLPDTPMAATPRGRHVYFRHPGGIVGNRVDIFAERRKNRCHAPHGFDLRGDGGFVVAPGSYFLPNEEERRGGKCDGEYRWIVRPGAVPFAAIPHWLHALLEYRADPFHTSDFRVKSGRVSGDSSVRRTNTQNRHHTWAAAALEGWCMEIADALNGTQNNAIFRAAARIGGLIAGGLIDEQDAITALAEAARLGGHPKSRATATIRSGIGIGKRSPVMGPLTNSPASPPTKSHVAAARRRLRDGGR